MFEQRNPATGETGRRFPALDARGIEERLARAASAYAAWRLSAPSERAALLSAIAERWEAAREDLARTVTFEMGKPIADARAEVDKCVAAFRFYAAGGEAMLADRTIDLAGGKRAVARWAPLGPVLAVMPWNFPLWQVVRFMAPTIMAGNVGLLKHASNVQGTAEWLERLTIEAGAPAGLFQNMAVPSDAIGAIIDDPRVVAVTLTGSEAAGVAVAGQAGRNLKKVVLELGGSDPFIVMPSADIDEAATVAARARTQNAGQSCICAKRMIVHRDVHDDFRDRFVAAMAAVKVGDPLDDATDMGPLSSTAGLADIEDQISRAEAAGAKRLGGGERLDGPGCYLTPAVIAGLDPESDLAREEWFGPVALLFEAAGIDDAVRIANAVPFGLGASIWTADAGERDRLVRDVEAGMIAVNAMLASSPEAPFGGVKRSGHGRELSGDGLHAFMNLKTVMLDQDAGS